MDDVEEVEAGMELDQLAPNLRGYTMETADAIYLPFVVSSRKGALQAYLEELEAKAHGQGKSAKVPNIIHPAMLHVLQKRGYQLTGEWSKLFGEMVDAWVKTPRQRQAGRGSKAPARQRK